MFFLIWGTKYIDKEVEGGIVARKRCPKCKEYKDLVEVRRQKWFSIFYIPIFPYGSEKSSFLKCRDCGTSYYLDSGDIDINDKSSLLDFDNRIVIACPSCKTKLKVKPFDKDEVEIKCGNCKHLFYLRKNYKG
ncbi:MAG TPA: zinc-ribbon domain-containing protein [Patescibacteria group bacterium]|nr:zinc-ribbon domain-containing protein [Patescibacteria group bacterium]